MSEAIQTKRCPKCKQIQDVSQFSKDKSTKDGFAWQCKECTRLYYKQYYQRRRAELLRYQNEYREQHKQDIQSYKRQYHQQNKKKIKQYQKRHRKTLRGHLYHLYANMCNRCNRPKDIAYKFYGGRGIQVRFTSFSEFFDYVVNELKVDPMGLTIDRIDSDGHYKRGNIRFITLQENLKNRKVRK